MSEINEYLREQRINKKIEELLTWRDFYLLCNNEWKAGLMEKKADRLKEKLV